MSQLMYEEQSLTAAEELDRQQRIVSLVKDDSRSSICRMILEDGSVFSLKRSIVLERNLAEGMTISIMEAKRLVRKAERRAAYHHAVRLLEQRDYSYKRMFMKLASQFSQGTCYEVLNRLAEENLINDNRLAKRLADYYIEEKHCGPERLVKYLRSRDLPDVVVQAAVNDYRNDEQRLWDSIQYQLETRCSRRLSSPPQPSELQKCRNDLYRAGFSSELIQEALSRWIDEEW